MKILAMERENPVDEKKEIQPFLREEALAAWRLTQTGQMREIYFNAERHTAVIILEAEGKNEAEKILGKLPLVREGFIYFDLIPLAPYDGFARLFSQGG